MMNDIGVRAKEAAKKLSNFKHKDKVLIAVANAITQNEARILEENRKDVEKGLKSGLSKALIDRLTLTSVASMVAGIYDIVNLNDPVGEVLEARYLDNGLYLQKISVPLGVIGIIYESRPNVTVDAFALAFKSGNAIILKGGKEAIHTNTILEKIIRENLRGVDENCLQLIKDTSRESTYALMKMDDYIDVLIPRGSAGLIKAVRDNSKIPVIATGEGNCHLMVDASADMLIARSIFRNAKTQRPGVCNAVEGLVLHKDIAKSFMAYILEDTPEVLFVGDERAVLYDDRIEPATDEDFYREYLDMKCSVKVVDSFEEGLNFINEHTTHHSESLISENSKHMERFLNEIDAAAVYVNASTRFSDGQQFGLGAELGISTQKLHARGPMGLKALTSYKYIVIGKGQIR
jgi:glutamate-5-semialdehyde dehydrogenase